MVTLKKEISTRKIMLVILWIVMLLTGLFVLSFWAETFRANQQIQSVASLSWSGYLVSSSSIQPQPEVNQISASWIVPQVNVSVGDSYSSVWVGIGGQFDKTLIQVGTEHNFVNGNAVYNAWYELLPDYAIKINSLQISPGDQINAAITIVNFNTNLWNIQITDSTTGQIFNQNFNYNSTRLSGEWMVERPTVNNRISTLTDFGTATLTQCQINLNGSVALLGNYSYSQIRMSNDAGIPLTRVSPVNSDGSSFSVSYLMGG